MKDMTAGSPTRLLLLFSVPLLIGNVFQQFYNVSDTVIVGRTIGVDSLAALGACGPLFFCTLGVFFGLTSGFAVITAQRFGAHDMAGVKRSIAISFVLCFLVGLLFMAVLIPLIGPMLRVLHVPDAQMRDAYLYTAIIYGGIWVMVFYNMISNIIRALGDSVTPLIFLVIACIVNVVLDLVFILVCGWGVPGVAAATVLAQVIAGAACWVYGRKKYRLLRLRKRDWVFERSFVWEHLRVAVPMGLQFAILGIGGFFQQRALNELGTISIAAFSAGCKVDQIAIQPLMSLGVAMATFAAQNYGAGCHERIRDGVRSCLGISTVFCVAGFLFMTGFSGFLSHLVVGDAVGEVHDKIREFLFYNSCSYILFALIIVYRNVLQGMGHALITAVSVGGELVARIFGAICLAAWWGYTGVCVAGPVSWACGMLPLVAAYYCIMRRYRQPRDRFTPAHAVCCIGLGGESR